MYKIFKRRVTHTDTQTQTQTQTNTLTHTDTDIHYRALLNPSKENVPQKPLNVITLGLTKSDHIK